MVEGGSRLGFLLEAAHAAFIFGAFRRQDFERDVATEPGVLGQPHFAHAAGAESGEDFVRAKRCAVCDGHFLISAVQFSTTLIGANGSSNRVMTRNRCPSPVTTKRFL